MPRAFISIGSNIDPERNVLAALRVLRRRLPIVGISTFYRNPARARPEQPDFYNGVIEVATELPPRAIKFDVLRPTETALGRTRTVDRYAARPIDLDLVLYGDVRIEEPDLVLPDPELVRQPFLARPLAELAPEVVPPGAQEPMAQLAARLPWEEMRPLPEYTERVREVLAHGP